VFSSCRNSDKTFVNIFEEECGEFFPELAESKFLETSAFQINYPINWEHGFEVSESDTSYVFMELLDSARNLELSDEELDIKYNNFQTISLTFGKMYEKLNYDTDFDIVHEQISKNKLNEIRETGVSSFNNRKARWVLYDDYSFEEDDLVCEVITACVTNSKYYMWIIIQTFGKHEKDLRKCQAMEILKTLKMKS